MSTLEGIPKIGDLVCVKTMVGGHQDIYRGRVLKVFPSTPDGAMVEVFALDYGFKNVVAAESLRQLTTLGRKEPFQVELYSRHFNSIELL